MKVLINGKKHKVKLYGKPKACKTTAYPFRLSTVGEAIREIRLIRGMTQKELGVAVGFSESTADIRIAQYETGKRKPKEELLNKLQAVLNCKIVIRTVVDYSLLDELKK